MTPRQKAIAFRRRLAFASASSPTRAIRSLALFPTDRARKSLLSLSLRRSVSLPLRCRDVGGWIESFLDRKELKKCGNVLIGQRDCTFTLTEGNAERVMGFLCVSEWDSQLWCDEMNSSELGTTNNSDGVGAAAGDFPPNYCLVQHLIYHTYTEERTLLPASWLA